MPTVEGLRISVDPGSRQTRTLTQWHRLPNFNEFELTRPDSEIFKTAGYCANLALTIHESRKGLEALVEVGRSVVGEWNNDEVDHIYTDRLENMDHWVKFFLRSIRRNFPNLYVTGATRAEGMTLRQDVRATKMRDFDPKNAALVFLNRWKVDLVIYSGAKHMQYTSQGRREDARRASQNWETAIWSLTKTLSHELVHVFVGFLQGGSRARTPRGAAHPGYADAEDIGESGRLWEGILFGGIPGEFEDSADSFGSQQAGVPYLQDIDGSDRCKRISQDWVADLARGRLQFPCTLSTWENSIRSDDLRSQRRHMSQVRAAAMRREVPSDMARQEAPWDRARGRRDVSRDDLRRINKAAVSSFRPSQYLVPQQV